jgi:AcrR family transcriptional regulator
MPDPAATPLEIDGDSNATPSRSQEKRRRIHAAARSICSQRGFDAARMEEIAAAAQVSKGTLYNFFRSKEDLFIATVLESYEDFRRRLDPRLDEASHPVDQLTALIDELARTFSLASEQLPVQRQAWAVIARNPEARERLFGTLREHYRGFDAGISEILRRGQRLGYVRPDVDPRLVANSWISIFDGLIYRNDFDSEPGGFGSASQLLRASLGALLDSVLCQPLEPPTAKAGT